MAAEMLKIIEVGMAQETIEIAVARLDERFMGMQSIIKELAADQRRMAESYEKLVESTQRISLLEADAISMKESLKILWEKIDQTAEKSSDKKGILLIRIFELTLAGIIGGIATHFGMKS